MHIAGSTYFEEIEFYGYENLFGSATRAAAAVACLASGNIHLVTCVGRRHIPALQSHSATYKFDVDLQETTEQTVGFRYFHGLTDGKPVGLGATEQDVRLEVHGSSAVLRFGMIEGTAVVSGDRVVYDPQSPEPEPFHENGSEAEHLALVLNASEARAMVEASSLDVVGERLLQYPSVEAAVIKCGAKGAILFGPDGRHDIPCYRTTNVWPIGSGDVFSGVFAYYWAEEDRSAHEAAQRASAAAAYFCETRVLPIPEDPQTATEFTGVLLPSSINMEHKQVYLAAPFFTLSQRWIVNEARRALFGLGVDVFSPIHDVGSAQSIGSAEDVASADLEGLRVSDSVLALVDDPDSGTSIEIGYARQSGIPVIAYSHNPEVHELTMLEGIGCAIFDHFPTAVYQAVWETQS